MTDDITVGAKIVVVLQHYSNAMELLLLHQDSDADDKQLFQDYINKCFEEWLEIFCLDGMSNYPSSSFVK